jgi:hypothetical protein
MIAVQRRSNIFETFAPFYNLLKAFGLLPFSFQGSIRDGNLKLNFVDKIHPIVVSVAHLLAFISVFYLVSVWKNILTNFLLTVMEIGFLINIATSFVSVFGLIVGREGFVRFLRTIDCSDREVNVLLYKYIFNSSL